MCIARNVNDTYRLRENCGNSEASRYEEKRRRKRRRGSTDSSWMVKAKRIITKGKRGSREVKRDEEERLSWNRYSLPCSNWISRGPSSISDKDLLFKSNVLRKLLIRRDRRTANASAAANPFF